MIELTLHPLVYATGKSKGLINLLERVWVREANPGNGTFFIISGFANYNGGVRFYPVFKKHIELGGKVLSIFSGSTSSRLTSKQVVSELLGLGAEVFIVNRKRLLHAKSYGASSDGNQSLVVSSGNFTGPGMSQNVEMSILIDNPTLQGMPFSWHMLVENVLRQKWDIYKPTLDNPTAPAWNLLYDESIQRVEVDETQLVTMLLTLGHHDTARINAGVDEVAGKGTQYFWLSKDCYDFFPPLTIPNLRGHKKTYSCLINMYYFDLKELDTECRVTFEAENNLDFRLGTRKLRHTKLASQGDLAAITRVGERDYELRVIKSGSSEFSTLLPYAVNFIGQQGKKYGYIYNDEFERILGIKVGKKYWK